MEKKVILLTDYYLPNNNANGLCIYRLGMAMVRMGYEVHTVAYLEKGLKKEEIVSGIFIHRIRPQFFYRMRNYYYKYADLWRGKICWGLALLCRRIKKIIFLRWYPMVSPLTARRYCKKVEEIARKYNVRNVVAGYNPLESAAASVWLKKRKENYKVITWFMDTFTLTSNAKKSKIIYLTGRKWEEKIYHLVDAVVNFPDYKEYFNSTIYHKYLYKMLWAGVPIDFEEVKPVVGKKSIFEAADINLLYTGGLSMEDRSPVYLLNIIDKCKIPGLKIHFFSRGNAEDYLKEMQKEHKEIVRHCQVPYEELLKAKNEADFMVNIGSRKEVILPSRLLEYIATGKPIVHIARRVDDPCLPYLNKYPDQITIFENESLDENVQKVKDFLTKRRNGNISKEELDNLYYENSSKYIAEMFHEVFAK